MEALPRYLGNLHEALPSHPHLTPCMLVLLSMLCGLVLGYERERKRKPAGMRTLSLICVGSTAFTLASILITGHGSADRTRIAAQVVAGVGFLGAGAIIRHRGTVIGMTTGAGIWVAAAVGMLIGGGYAADGAALTGVVLMMLTIGQRLEERMADPCVYAVCRVTYRTEHGKTRLHVLRILDQHHFPQNAWSIATGDVTETASIRYCTHHRQHRAFLYHLVDVPDVVEIATHTQ